MQYQHRNPNNHASNVHISMRENASVDEEGTFSVSADRSADIHQRLIDAGHRPLDPAALPDGVEYDTSTGSDAADESGSESGENAASSDGGDDATDGQSDTDGGDETTEEQGEGSVAVDAGDVDPSELDDLDRSELYDLGNDLGMDWDWSEAGSESEMREELKTELANDGE